MKEWSNPQLFSLSVENTFTKGESENQHWCHALNGGLGGWHSTEDCTHNHGGGSCKDPDHQWSEEHKSSCCCIGVSAS